MENMGIIGNIGNMGYMENIEILEIWKIWEYWNLARKSPIFLIFPIFPIFLQGGDLCVILENRPCHKTHCIGDFVQTLEFFTCNPFKMCGPRFPRG